MIKGKRLKKLEASFASEAAAADDTDVTEEEESNDESEQKEGEEKKVGVGSRTSYHEIKSFSLNLHLLYFMKCAEKEAETSQRAVGHGGLLQERPLQWLRGRQDKPELL